MKNLAKKHSFLSDPIAEKKLLQVNYLICKTSTDFGQMQSPVMQGTTTLLSFQLQKLLKASGINTVIPDSLQQAKIGKCILNLVSSRYDNKDRDMLVKVIKGFGKKKVKNIILACTDLQLLIPKQDNFQIHDTMKILLDATAKKVTSI